MFMMTSINQEMPAIDVQDRIKRAVDHMGDAMGIDGQFRLTYSGGPDHSECYLIHAYRQDRYALHETSVVITDATGRAFGSLEGILAALDRYVSERAPAMLVAAE